MTKGLKSHRERREEDENNETVRKTVEKVGEAFTDIKTMARQPLKYLSMEIRDRPEIALDRIDDIVQRRKRREYGENEALVDAFAGGPNEGVIEPVLNAIGENYPNFPTNRKLAYLRKVLGILDHFNYEDVQAHMENLREPILFGDIVTARRIYWPGLYEGKRILDSIYKRRKSPDAPFKNFEELCDKIIDENGLFKPKKIDSDFIVAVFFIISKYGDEYSRIANQTFLTRVTYAYAQKHLGHTEKDSKERKEETKKLEKVMPKSLKGRVTAASKSFDEAYLRELRDNMNAV